MSFTSLDRNNNPVKTTRPHYIARWVMMETERNSLHFAELTQDERFQFNWELLKQKNYVNRNDRTRLEAYVVLIAHRQSMITLAEWEIVCNHQDNGRWWNCIDALYLKVVGYERPRQVILNNARHPICKEVEPRALEWLKLKVDDPSTPSFGKWLESETPKPEVAPGDDSTFVALFAALLKRMNTSTVGNIPPKPVEPPAQEPAQELPPLDASELIDAIEAMLAG